MKIKFYLDKSITRKNGSHPLRLYIYLSSKDRRYPMTEYTSLAADWDFEKEEPKKSHPLYLAILDYLYEHRRKILTLQNSRNTKSAEQVENYILGNSDSIYNFWKIRIKEEEEKEKLKKEKMIGTGNSSFYKVTLSVWENYYANLKYEEITFDFLVRFKNHKSKTCNSGGINVYLKSMRAIYNLAIKRGYYTPASIVSLFDGIMEKKEPTKDKYLTLDEMKIVHKANIDHNFYKYFMLCFYLGGLDFIDIASIKKEHIRNGRIKFTRFKGGTNEIIDNFVFPEAKEILEYFNDPDDEYLLPLHKFSYKPYRGRYVREIRLKFKDLKVESYIDSKSPRYSFINIGGKELYLNRDIIKELTGHSQNDTHSIYEGKFPDHIKDEIHRKIIDAIIA